MSVYTHTHTIICLSSSALQLGFDLDREVYPLVVHAVVDEGDGRETADFFHVPTSLLR